METPKNNPIPPKESQAMGLFERIANSLILKMATIFFLIIIMLIPLNLVEDLVNERKAREITVSSEISSKWGQDQVISSPILAVPYETKQEIVQKDDKGKEYIVESRGEEWAFLLPNQSNMQTDVKPESLKRGIYQSVVYNTNTVIKGDFQGFDLERLPIQPSKMKWAEAKLIMGIQDLKGLLESPMLTTQDSSFTFQRESNSLRLFPNSLVVNLKLKNAEEAKFPFEIKLDLRGSKSLNYLPLASHTNIAVKGSWSNPSFNGGYLPENREVKQDEFQANWSIPSFARRIPQQWIADNSRLYNFSGLSLSEMDYPTVYGETAVDATESAQSVTIQAATDMDMVQVNFLPEVNSYQKTTRATKYGVLVIILTFVSLFFTEIIKKQRIHLIQYILIGAAMVLFYSLLLAISEHLGFDLAYLFAAIATIVLIASFIFAITKDRRTALLFTAILGLFYSFIFVLMQLRDYSLIVGTVGIFIILAILMRLSTKINWYQFEKK